MEEDMVTLEAALYVSGRALTLEELSNIIGKSQSTVQKLLDELGFEYSKRKGALEVVALPRDRYAMQLRPELTPSVGKLIPGGLLSYATLQTCYTTNSGNHRNKTTYNSISACNRKGNTLLRSCEGTHREEIC